MYEPRTYRHWIKDTDLVSFNVVVRETDLHIRARSNLEADALEAVIECRSPLEGYIEDHPLFFSSLEPVSVEESAPAIVKDMAQAAWLTGVGPMAAVAGAVAEVVGKRLLVHSPEIIVENGGDIFISSKSARIVGIYAGESKFRGRMGLKIEADETPCGVCTSSGTVGHSLSFGKADAAIIIAKSVALADAVATAVCNRVKSEEDIYNAVDFAKGIEEVDGVLIIFNNRLGAWGNVKLVDI